MKQRAGRRDLPQTGDAPDDVELAIEIVAFRNVWAALVLGASRTGHARAFVEPTVARNASELADAARRSILGYLPHLRVIRPDDDAKLNQVFWNYSRNLRRLQRSLFHVLSASPKSCVSVWRVIPVACEPMCCYASTSRRRIRTNCRTSHSLWTVPAPRNEFGALDFLAALGELEPQLWSDVELAFFERDLDRMAAYGGPLWQPIERPLLQARAGADDRQDLGL
jgi:hypothetical protein